MNSRKNGLVVSWGKRSRTTRILSVVFVLLTLELATRLFRPDDLNKVRFDPDIGYLMRPNLRVTITDCESHVTHELTANSLGFRGSEWAVPKPQNVRRIAVLGDSYVDARSYELERTFCGRLQQLLNESSTSEQWEVMNLGAPGLNTSSELAVYNKFVKPLEPEIVILCVTLSNDLRENVWELSQGCCAYQEFDEEGNVTVIPPFRKTDPDVKCSSRFYQWQKIKIQKAINYFRTMSAVTEVFDPLSNAREEKLAEARCITRTPLDEPYRRAWSVTRKLLESFRIQVQDNGSRFYVVSIPNSWQVHQDLFDMMRSQQPDSEEFDIDQPIAQLAEITDQLEIDRLELTPVFRKELAEFERQFPGKTGEDLLFLNGIGHFSEHAHQLVARELYRYLKLKESPAQQADLFAEVPADAASRQ